MKVIYKKLPSRKVKAIVTIGSFDGVHLGHQFILKKVKQQSQQKGLKSVVITFDVPPRQFLNKSGSTSSKRPQKSFLGCLTNLEEKTLLIKSSGIDYLWILKTRESFLGLSADDFMAFILKYFDVNTFIVGQDFHFGYKGQGNVDYLQKLKKKYNFKVTVVTKKSKKELIISSSLIRNLVKKGQFRKAKDILGRHFSLKGNVTKGKGLGSKIGFSTANIFIPGHIIPGRGVYATYVVLEKKVYLAAVNIGVRPSLGKRGKEVVEVHIINFGRNILGKKLKVIFLQKIRAEKKFKSRRSLSKAIEKDVNFITTKYSIQPLNRLQVLVA